MRHGKVSTVGGFISVSLFHIRRNRVVLSSIIPVYALHYMSMFSRQDQSATESALKQLTQLIRTDLVNIHRQHFD